MATKSALGGTLAGSIEPTLRRIDAADLKDALRKGLDDFLANPTQLLFLGVIYPIVGLLAATAADADADVLPLLYPLVAGLSLVGPIAAVGLYELSRRREQGLEVAWYHAFGVLLSPSLLSIAALGFILLVVFVAWLASAQALYQASFGGMTPASATQFLRDVLTTPAGWQLIVLGNAIGFLFAVVVLALTVVSLPMLLDRDVGLGVAVQISVRAVLANPAAMALWGLIVAGALLIGCLPLFIGLAIVMPILGHSTWHLYRKVVAYR